MTNRINIRNLFKINNFLIQDIMSINYHLILISLQGIVKEEN